MEWGPGIKQMPAKDISNFFLNEIFSTYKSKGV